MPRIRPKCASSPLLAELPFAGHPNVGTAFALARTGSVYGRAVGDRLIFEEKAGLVPLDILRDGDTVLGARLSAPRLLSRGGDIAAEIVAAACSLVADDIETGRHRPCVAGCGTSFIFAELKSRRALEAAQPRIDVFARHFPVDGATGIHLYWRDGVDGIDVRTRMFAPLHGVPEDPATGSANVALVGLLASLRPEPDLSLDLRIAQGVEDGSPEPARGLGREARRHGRRNPDRRALHRRDERHAHNLRLPDARKHGKIARPKGGRGAMSRVFAPAALFAAGLVVGALPAMAQSKATIQKLDDQFAAAFNKGDAAAVAAMYTSDAYVLPAGAPLVKGADIQGFWNQAMQQLGDIKCTALDVKPLGRSAAREIGNCTFKTKGATPQDGAALNIRRRLAKRERPLEAAPRHLEHG